MRKPSETRSTDARRTSRPAGRAWKPETHETHAAWLMTPAPIRASNEEVMPPRFRVPPFGSACHRITRDTRRSGHTTGRRGHAGTGRTACPLRARSGGEPGSFTVTYGQAGMPSTCVSADQRPRTRSLPSWSCGFDSRHPLHIFPYRKDIQSSYSITHRLILHASPCLHLHCSRG